MLVRSLCYHDLCVLFIGQSFPDFERLRYEPRKTLAGDLRLVDRAAGKLDATTCCDVMIGVFCVHRFQVSRNGTSVTVTEFYSTNLPLTEVVIVTKFACQTPQFI